MREPRNPGQREGRLVPRLRLLADDLTGALDSAAQFVPLVGSVPTFWHDAMPERLPASAALDSSTRELDAAAAAKRVAALVPALVGADIAFKKIDSLLRGPVGAEIAACVQANHFATCIIAPAFPARGRIMREGRQLVRRDGDWRDTGVDLAGALREFGLTVRQARPGDAVPLGISLWDAETDADLERIVAAGRESANPLWCGTGGLAGALAGPERVPTRRLERPLLGLFGSDHDVTIRQLQACDPHWLRLSASRDEQEAAPARDRLNTSGLALASFDLPQNLSRAAAAEQIATMLAALARSIAAPRTLVVAGGETLRALCGVLAATSLEVVGQVLPGVPVSLLHGGTWDGVTVVSKSGAFGDAGLLRRLAGIDADPTG